MGCDKQDVTEGKSVGGEAPSSMDVETLGLQQTRYVTKGKNAGGEAPSGMDWETLILGGNIFDKTVISLLDILVP